jgi:hypothetical protein
MDPLLKNTVQAAGGYCQDIVRLRPLRMWSVSAHAHAGPLEHCLVAVWEDQAELAGSTKDPLEVR